MQIHELPAFSGTPGASDYLAIDNGTITQKIGADELGITTEMTQAEAVAGTVTDPRVITPAVYNAALRAIFPTMTAAELDAGTVTDPRVIAPDVLRAAIDAVISDAVQQATDAATAAVLDEMTIRAGDAIIIRSVGSAQYPGKWASTTALRFFLPFSKPITATSVTVTGTFIVSCAGKTLTATIGTGCSATADIVNAGVGVVVTFTSTQASASSNHAAAIQSNPLTVTFS